MKPRRNAGGGGGAHPQSRAGRSYGDAQGSQQQSASFPPGRSRSWRRRASARASFGALGRRRSWSRQEVRRPVVQRGGGEDGLRAVGVRPDEAVEIEPGQDLEEEGPARGGRAERPQRQAEGVVVTHARHGPLEELGRVGYHPPGVEPLLSRGGSDQFKGKQGLWQRSPLIRWYAELISRKRSGRQGTRCPER